MSIYLYKGEVIEVCAVKSARLKSGLCHSLKQPVQPVQLRLSLTEFCDLEEPNVWHKCFEVEEGASYDDIIGEFICGADIPEVAIPENGILPLILPQGQLTVDVKQPMKMTFMSSCLELKPKFRRVDGLQMRTLPPSWEGSRLLWRLSDCTLVGLSYPEATMTTPVASPAVQLKREERHGNTVRKV